MMTSNQILFLMLLILILILLFRYLFRASRRKTALHRRFRKAPPAPPVAEADSPAYELAILLERTISDSWSAALKDRVLKEHPQITEREYEWRWLELQRFFVMCSVLKQVPMFSPAVDEVWHEMLMYTHDYQQFSKQFLGQMLHHIPSGEPSKPMPEERAWFDLVYVELFGWNYYSALLWGPFFRNPLPKEELEMYRDYTAGVDSSSRFNAWAYKNSPESRKAIDTILSGLRFRVGIADEKLQADHRMDFRNTDLLLTSAVFFSMNDPENFVNHMAPEQDLQRRDSSGCSSSACGSGGADSHHHNHHNCSSSGCSSGSSCSSSSCGGGCGGGGGD